MKVHVVEDKELVTMIRAALKENDGYCPCIYNSKGKSEYKCMCQDFLNNVPVGNACHCGLYIKDEM